jgi:murein DD-endopeptidase MepM/ murein hydrolase activator NlpD
MTIKFAKTFLVLFFVTGFFVTAVGKSFADEATTTINALKAKIAEQNALIKQLDAEIAATQQQIDESQSQQKTLKGAISTLDAERKKVLAQINVTQQKISMKQLEVESLGLSITDKNNSIQKSSLGLSQTIRNMDLMESGTMVSMLLNSKNLSEVWNVIEETGVIGAALKTHLGELKNLKQDLEKNKAEAEAIRQDLVTLNKELAGRKKIAEAARADKQKLLAETKNQESEYQKLLKKQLADKDAFEQELLSFESQLNFAIDPSKLPQTGTGILHWPLDFIKITQYFGNTDFATKNPQVYNGMGHNGIDLKASIGTSVKAALNGTVKGVGDTDTVCPRTSYGKWIFIEHSNGLSTIYAHLSAFAVKAGDQVSTSQIIGWSGNTGYTTGPHLHFGVYATQGVKIMSRQSKICNGVYTMPIADFKAYLNPLSYL